MYHVGQCLYVIMFHAGYIAQFGHCWEDLIENNDMLDTILTGVKLPLTKKTGEFELENYFIPELHKVFISKEIDELLISGAIEKCVSKPQCVSPIKCVPKKARDGGSKLRLIIDLRRVNECVQSPTFKYEDVNIVLDQIQQSDELISVDLKNGFQHVLVNTDYRCLLGFKWNGIYYRFRVLPFGLSCSPYFFCKILRSIANHLRSLQLRVCFYMDDILLMASAEKMVEHSNLLLLTLQRLGWQVNWEKSQLQPTQQICYIGYKISTDHPDGNPILQIPVERIRKLRKNIRHILTKGVCSARSLARIAGQCVSMSKAVLPAKLLLRNIYRLLRRRTHWEDNLVLDTPTCKDLIWWQDALQNWNGRSISTKAVEVQMATDASQTGWGAHILNSTKQAAGFWDTHMSAAPSNAREMMAVIMGILSFKEDLMNHSVQVLTDNVSTAAYIMHLGGPSPGLSSMVANLWSICYRLNIHLTARYLAGRENQTADALSRIQPQLEWSLHPAVFKTLENMWGRHTVDRFASLNNHLLPEYNSRYWDPLTRGVDALAQSDWAKENNFVNCPFNMLPQVLQKVLQTKAVATIIAPWWPGRPWFQILQRMTVAPPWRIPKRRGVIWTGGTRPEPLRNLRWQLFAWRVSGNQNSLT